MKTNTSLANITNPTALAGWFDLICTARLLPLLLLLTFPAAVKAQDFTYTTNNGTITVTGYNCSGGAASIPSTINGLPVTSIGDEAFFGCTNLSSVTIPDSVTTIGDWAFGVCNNLVSILIGNSLTNISAFAFAGCHSLASVTIPNSVINIGDRAFSACTSLSTVTIPNSVASIGDNAFFYGLSMTNVMIGSSVTNIGAGAFHDCFNLTAITVDAFNSDYSSMDGVLFNKSQTELIHWPQGKGGGYTIPNSVTGIGSYTDAYLTSGIAIGTFFGSSLTSVTISSSLTNIPGHEFSGSTSLTNITIPARVTQIGDYALADCSSLTGAYFQGNAPSFGSEVLRGDDNVTVYYLPGTLGWGTTFAGRPTAPWVLPNPVILTSGPGFGVQTNGFGFTISWATNLSVVVEACTSLINPAWSPLATNTLSNGSSYFRDSDWTNYAGRFYRLRLL